MTFDNMIDLLRAELANVVDDLPGEVPVDAALRDDLGIDSLDVLEFVSRVEYRCGVTVPDEDWPRLGTLREIAGYVLEIAAAR
jgi:acyl carrier protein